MLFYTIFFRYLIDVHYFEGALKYVKHLRYDIV
jgi:hypothetical protein